MAQVATAVVLRLRCHIPHFDKAELNPADFINGIPNPIARAQDLDTGRTRSSRTHIRVSGSSSNGSKENNDFRRGALSGHSQIVVIHRTETFCLPEWLKFLWLIKGVARIEICRYLNICGS